jgi:hypothetical protein
MVIATSLVHDDPLAPHDFTWTVCTPPAALMLALTPLPLTIVVELLPSRE